MRVKTLLLSKECVWMLRATNLHYNTNVIKTNTQAPDSHIWLLTLCVGELLSESVGCDDQHPLDSPEQDYVIALQLDESMSANKWQNFGTSHFQRAETKAAKAQVWSSFRKSFLPQNQQSASGSSKSLFCRGYSGKAHSARSVFDTAGAMCP